jgi:hypothetical protein
LWCRLMAVNALCLFFVSVPVRGTVRACITQTQLSVPKPRSQLASEFRVCKENRCIVRELFCSQGALRRSKTGARLFTDNP